MAALLGAGAAGPPRAGSPPQLWPRASLRELVTVADELRDAGLQHLVSLPRVAAIGAQSSGKSSVIESIVGLDLLPRGGSLVTRRPLELRLVHLGPQEGRRDDAWAVFDRLDGNRKFTDFDEVRKEIVRQTDAVAGRNKGIVDEPIVCTVYSVDAPDLTLIDLPGITRVPVKGSDQTEDVEQLTRDITLHYIRDPQTIILAVLPANQDAAVSDALQLARQVDPDGLRSIGVITKVDIMDEGTDACAMLRNEEIPLQLGYVGVRMRSEQDIKDAKPLRQALREEAEWFRIHEVYSTLDPGLVGTAALVEKLSWTLSFHLQRRLPEVAREIHSQQRDIQERLAALGEGAPPSGAGQVQAMWTLVADYCEIFRNTLRGRFDPKMQKYALLPQPPAAAAGAPWMHTGVRVRGILAGFLTDIPGSPSLEVSDEDLEREASAHDAGSLPGFPSSDTFEYLALPHLEKLNAPSVECVHSVADALEVLAQQIARSVFRRCPRLAEAVVSTAQRIIQRERESTRAIVEQQVKCHTGFLFTNDPEYMLHHGFPAHAEQRVASVFARFVQSLQQSYEAASRAIADAVGTADQARDKHKGRGTFVEVYRRRLDAYVALTVRSVRDTVPKLVGFYLIRSAQDKLQFELLSELNRSHKVEELLDEPASIRSEREQLGGQLRILEQGLRTLAREELACSRRAADMMNNCLGMASGPAAAGTADCGACRAAPPARPLGGPLHRAPPTSRDSRGEASQTLLRLLGGRNHGSSSLRPHQVGILVSCAVVALLAARRPGLRRPLLLCAFLAVLAPLAACAGAAGSPPTRKRSGVDPRSVVLEPTSTPSAKV